ncbi:MAG TPA: hemolysin family protein [Candidatus Limnocylindria bacterium]|nr:hemolysin family protein [Candidatus Limnocylindria bacterium]
MDLGGALPGIGLTLFLLFLNAFFVAAEFAIVRVRATQLDELAAGGSARAKLGAHIADHIDSYLSACQVGITGASLALGIVGEPAVAKLIEPLFGWLLERSETAFHFVSFAIAFAIITYLHIVVGEQAPKYLAIQRALPTTLWSAHPLHYFYRVLYPFIWSVNTSANALLRRVGIKPGEDLEAHSEEELKMLVAVSTRKGILQESERVLVGNALDFADTYVRQVMIPRTEMVAVPDDTPIGGLFEMARQHPFTRYPVFRGDLDHIVGVVHLKDLVSREPHGGTAADVMRGVPIVPETMRLDQALAEFRRQRTQLAIVADEFGGTAGLITVEDIIEELVGDVQDEFDREVPQFVPESNGTYLIDGLAPLDALRERLAVDLDDEPYDTVGGLVFGRLGRVAKVGDAIQVAGWRFDVTAVDGRRVARVRVRRQPVAS